MVCQRTTIVLPVALQSTQAYEIIDDLFFDWCPGPDLNRHDRVNESQDFKSCASTSFATGALRETIQSFLGVEVNLKASHICG